MRLYIAEMLAAIRVSLADRTNFMLLFGGMVLNNGFVLLMWFLFFAGFRSVRGWRVEDMALQIGVLAISFGVAGVFAGGYRDMGERGADLTLGRRGDHRLAAADGRGQRRRRIERGLASRRRHGIAGRADAFHYRRAGFNRQHRRAVGKLRRRIGERVRHPRRTGRLRKPPHRLVELVRALLACISPHLSGRPFGVVEHERQPLRQHGAQKRRIGGKGHRCSSL